MSKHVSRAHLFRLIPLLGLVPVAGCALSDTLQTFIQDLTLVMVQAAVL
jgi:hypothetical protein